MTLDAPKSNTGKLCLQVQLLTLLYTILVELVPLLHTLIEQDTVSHTYLLSFSCSANKYTDRAIRCVLIKGPFKYLNDRFSYPFIYLNL